ncbi:hypothetical protein B0H19DRAFT_696134 [Mycena capillaripes]|nr:hypothetical protein B0H19DRAFT_696134 [Mycena capillaripes]
MTRRAPLVVLLAALTILCQTAPLNSRRELSSSTTTSSSVDVPLPSAATQNATSTPTLTMVPNWAAYTNGTRGYALNQLLSQGISSDAPQRWVTADGIASTQIGGSDPAGSNKDLDAAINTVFGDESNHRTWVDTYIDFLLKAGNSSLAEGATIFKELAGNKTAWAAEQVKLVRAYEAAHPGNISYVGVYIGNVSRVDGLDLGQMEDWARRGGDANCTSSADGKLASSSRTLNEASNSSSGDNCTFDSSGSYTAKDYKKFLAVASQNSDMEKKVAALKITLWNSKVSSSSASLIWGFSI